MADETVPISVSRCATSVGDSAPGPGSFGRYRVLQRLGEGGMGEVWLAEQREPVQREVAIKIIKAGMYSTEVVARFEAERQALALMDHPAIATVFDGGTTTEGRPYFAMEYVKGEPITDYCDRHRLGTRERLALFIQVCEGVQHAHQKGVIHRDLKPSNVLVAIQDDRAVPKIIDFGIAKATARHLTERSVFTELGVLIGTPEYMSPEQAEMNPLDIDTRTDIYALGVLLYELLTGLLPFEEEFRRAGLAEIQRVIREKVPARPSTRLTQLGPGSHETASRRGTDARRLIGDLRGDLDWITMKALEKDRTRRYDTAKGLANDILRHLNHEPVVARPPSVAYRTGRFVRRHRFGVAVAAASLVVLLGFGATMAVQARRIALERDRADRETEVAKRVADFLVGLFEVSDPGEARGNSITAREILDAGAERVERELSGQRAVQARLMETIGTVYGNLGLFDKSAALLEQALALNRAGNDDVLVAENLHALGVLWINRGNLDRASSLFEESLAIRRLRLPADDVQIARSLNSLGIVRWNQGRADEAAALLDDSLAIKQRALGEDHPDLISSVTNLGMVKHARGDVGEAEALFKRAQGMTERHRGPDHPDLAMVLNNLGSLYEEQGRRAEAEPLYQRALAIWEKTLGPDHPDVAIAVHNLANLYRNLGRYAEAEPLYRRSYAVWEKTLGDRHPYVGISLREQAALHREQGRPEAAAPLYERALRVFAHAEDEQHLNEIATLEAYIPVLQGLGRAAEADRLATRLHEIGPQPPGDEGGPR